MVERDADAAEQSVKEYYDANSERFLAYGEGGGQGAIHRAVWGPGVEDHVAAFNYVNELMLDRLSGLGLERARVVDLGCGVGASLMYLAERTDMDGLGITLSPVQAAIAQQRFVSSSLAESLRCVQGSFTNVPAEAASMDAAIAVEAFIHASEPERFLSEAARLLRPGGLLLLCDDFLSPRAASAGEALGARQRRWLREFKTGWRVHNLGSVSDTLSSSVDFELVEDLDLNPHLELGRPRDVAIRWLVRAGRVLPLKAPWWGNLLGGNALQQCLLNDVISYRFLVLRRRA